MLHLGLIEIALEKIEGHLASLAASQSIIANCAYEKSTKGALEANEKRLNIALEKINAKDRAVIREFINEDPIN